MIPLLRAAAIMLVAAAPLSPSLHHPADASSGTQKYAIEIGDEYVISHLIPTGDLNPMFLYKPVRQI